MVSDYEGVNACLHFHLFHIDWLRKFTQGDAPMFRSRFLVATAMLFSALTAFGNSPSEAKPLDAVSPHHHELALIDTLTRCVDTWSMGVNAKCMKEKVLPALGLKSGDVLWGEWGLNSDGRFFSLVVRHTSTSKKTKSLFEVTLYIQRHDRGQITFEAHDGHHYGTVETKDSLINIYDLGRGDSLVDDNAGNVVNSLSRADRSKYGHGIGGLLFRGKTVGTILVERLNALEKQGQGGPQYWKDAMWRHQAFEEMGKEHRPTQLRFKF